MDDKYDKLYSIRALGHLTKLHRLSSKNKTDKKILQKDTNKHNYQEIVNTRKKAKATQESNLAGTGYHCHNQCNDVNTQIVIHKITLPDGSQHCWVAMLPNIGWSTHQPLRKSHRASATCRRAAGELNLTWLQPFCAQGTYLVACRKGQR